MTRQRNECSSDLIPRQKKIDFHLTARNLHELRHGQQRNSSLGISAEHTRSDTPTLTHIGPAIVPLRGELREATHTGDT